MISRAEYLPTAGDRIGGFMLLEPLGRGAMGQVYRAKDETLGREVAIKFIDLSDLKNEYLINEVKKRFIREARVLAAINHPNVVEIYSASLEFRCPYIVMQFFPGKALFEYQDEVGVIDYKRCCVIGLQICEALDYCWENYQVMHRDLKPANVMINDSGHIKIIDWGIAKVTKDLTMGVSLATRSDMRLGTPHFMAPEQQINPGDVTYLADIYSMGMIMWQMLVGTLPFTANSEAVIFSQKQKGPERNLTRLIPELPDPVAELIYRMLDPSTASRISSYAEIRSILQREINTFQNLNELFPKADRPRLILRAQPSAVPLPPPAQPIPKAKTVAPEPTFQPPGLVTDHQIPTELDEEDHATDKREKRLVILHPAGHSDDLATTEAPAVNIEDVPELEPLERLEPPKPMPPPAPEPAMPPTTNNFVDNSIKLVTLPDSQAVDAEFWPGKEIGRFKIVERLGIGGMGVVMRGTDQTSGNDVAMKFLVCDPKDMKLRIAQIQEDDATISQLRHDALACVHENCNIEGYNIVISDLCLNSDGRPSNLFQCAKKHGNQNGLLNQYDVRSLLLSVLEALSYTHSVGIVHCDLKPENLLFSNGNNRKWYGNLRITDFGISRIIGEEFHQKAIRKSLRYANQPSGMKDDIRSLVSSYEYMSPEQRRGESATVRSDLYSVGLIVLQMLTGQRHLQIHKRPSTIAADIDPGWDHILLRVLKEDPEERYHSAAEMAADTANLPF